MQFTHLSELSNLVKPESTETLIEAKSQASDFDGISSVIGDCLADLDDKVASLMALAKATGAVKLDTVKDKEGLTVFKKLDKMTKEYTKAMKKLMAEAEAMVMQVAEGVDAEGKVLTEGKVHYDDSADFTEDLGTVGMKIHEIKKIVRSPAWKNWMQVTDHNFGAPASTDEDGNEVESAGFMAMATEFDQALTTLDKSFDKLEDALHNAA